MLRIEIMKTDRTRQRLAQKECCFFSRTPIWLCSAPIRLLDRPQLCKLTAVMSSVRPRLLRGRPSDGGRAANGKQICIYIYIYIYIYMYTHTHICIYLERERETYVYIYIYMHLYIYIYMFYMYIYIYVYSGFYCVYDHGKHRNAKRYKVETPTWKRTSTTPKR